MIPIEYFWFALIFMFGIIGAARGLNRELGVTTILLLSLFVLRLIWRTLGARITPLIQQGPLTQATGDVAAALYFTIIILFVTFISYEGVTLQFPVRQQKGVPKGIFGFIGGLLNGYLVVGTIWDVFRRANYFGLTVPIGGTRVPISSNLTALHNTLVNYLPLTVLPEIVLLVLGMILLLAIVLK